MNVGIERFLLLNVAAGQYSMHLAVATHNGLLLLSAKDCCMPIDLDTQNILQLRFAHSLRSKALPQHNNNEK